MSDSDDPCIASGPDGTYDQPLNIAAVFIILTASLLGTIAPLFFQRHPRYLRYPFAIILGKHVGTGVLLALALIHLLGPAVQTLTDECLPSKWSSEEDGYSYSPLFAMLSALAMHLIENSVLEYTVYSKQGGTESHSHSHSHGHGHGHGGHGGGLQLTELRSKSSAAASVTSESKEYEEVAERMEEGYGATVGDDGAAECTDDRHGSSSGESSQHRRYHGDAVAMKQAYQSAYDAHTKVGVIHPTVAVPDSPITSPTSHASMAAAHSPTSSSSTPFTALTTPTTPIAHHTHTHHRHHQTKADYDAADTAVHTLQAAAGHSHGVLFDSGAQRTIGAYILEFGLTAHSIIVGITVGVAAHSDLVTLIPALTFHQFFEGFALGARLASCQFSVWNECLLTFIYSCSAPVGIAIGIGISHTYQPNSTSALITQGTFDSVSAGILLYVAFVQMMAVEFADDYRRCGRDGVKKISLYAAMYCGAGVMAVIGKWL